MGKGCKKRGCRKFSLYIRNFIINASVFFTITTLIDIVALEFIMKMSIEPMVVSVVKSSLFATLVFGLLMSLCGPVIKDSNYPEDK